MFNRANQIPWDEQIVLDVIIRFGEILAYDLNRFDDAIVKHENNISFHFFFFQRIDIFSRLSESNSNAIPFECEANVIIFIRTIPIIVYNELK